MALSAVLNSVSKQVSSRDQLLDFSLSDISLSVAPGEILGLIGLSGAGKSTLLRVFNLLERPDTGEVRIGDRILFKDGKPQITRRELAETRQKIGMVFQNFSLLSNKTVEENVSLPLQIAGWSKADQRARVRDCLELVELSSKATVFPNQLSGGQRQRVAIARAIANTPHLLLADEPTSALDPITKNEVLTCLENINRALGVSIVIATHEMSLVRRTCHRLAILDQGRVLETLSREDDRFVPQSKIGRILLELA